MLTATKVEAGLGSLSPAVERFPRRRHDGLDQRRQRLAVRDHTLDRFRDAESVPNFEDALLPIETGPHGRIDARDIVGHLGNPGGGVEKQFAQTLPQKPSWRRVRFDDLLDARDQIAVRTRLFENRPGRLPRLAIVHRFDIENEAVRAWDIADFLVETLAGLIAEKSFLDHRAQERGRIVDLPLLVLGHKTIDGFGHIQADVEPGEVRQTKRRHARAPNEGSRQRVDFLDRETLLNHRLERVHDRKEKDAIGNEIGPVFREYSHFAQAALAKLLDEISNFGRGLGRRDEFD